MLQYQHIQAKHTENDLQQTTKCQESNLYYLTPNRLAFKFWLKSYSNSPKVFLHNNVGIMTSKHHKMVQHSSVQKYTYPQYSP